MPHGAGNMAGFGDVEAVCDLERQWTEGKSDWIGSRSEYLEGEKVDRNWADSSFRKVGYNRRGQ